MSDSARRPSGSRGGPSGPRGGRRDDRRGPGADRRGGGPRRDRPSSGRGRSADGRGARDGGDAIDERPEWKRTGGAKDPIGLDRARKRRDAPARRTRTDDAPPRPPLPEDEKPDLPKTVVREISRTLGHGHKANDIALALSIASAAIDEQRPDVARQLLTWAKYEAPRVAPVREAFGVTLYLEGDFAGALSELQAYRRLTGRVDQNHLIADCLRALGRDLDQIASSAEALLADGQSPEDRRAEAAIVWGSALADDGQVRSGRVVLNRFLERARSGDAEHDLRVRYVAADLAQRDNDLVETRRQLQMIAAVDPDFLDVEDRLDEFGSQTS